MPSKMAGTGASVGTVAAAGAEGVSRGPGAAALDAPVAARKLRPGGVSFAGANMVAGIPLNRLPNIGGCGCVFWRAAAMLNEGPAVACRAWAASACVRVGNVITPGAGLSIDCAMFVARCARVWCGSLLRLEAGWALA